MCPLNPSPEILRQQLGIGINVWHFSGHGVNFNDIKNEITLGFVDTNGNENKLSTKTICDLAKLYSKVSGNGCLELIILSSCSSADLGRQIFLIANVSVICWETSVDDLAAFVFFKRILGKILF
jgi:hypothetical protein